MHTQYRISSYTPNDQNKRVLQWYRFAIDRKTADQFIPEVPIWRRRGYAVSGISNYESPNTTRSAPNDNINILSHGEGADYIVFSCGG